MRKRAAVWSSRRRSSLLHMRHVVYAMSIDESFHAVRGWLDNVLLCKDSMMV